MDQELVTYKSETGIINVKALAANVQPRPPYPLQTIAGIPGFIVDWLIYEPSLRLDDVDAPDSPEQAPQKWKYHRIENDYALRPRMLVSGTPGNEPRAVANVSRDAGFVHAATYLWAESEQDVLLETDHYYAFAISIDAQPVIDRMDAAPKVSYGVDENIHRVRLKSGPNLLAWKIRCTQEGHTAKDKHSLRLTSLDMAQLSTVRVALSAATPEERREQQIVIGRRPNEIEQVRHFVSNYYPRTSSYNYFNRLYNQSRSCEFHGNTRAQFQRWQQRTRQALLDVLGKPPEACDLDPQTIMTVAESSYTRTLLELQVEQDLWMPVFLFTPKNLLKDGAAIVYVGGHGGIDGSNGEYILDCVNRGYLVLSVESRWYHRRSDPVEFSTSLLRDSFRVHEQDVHFGQHMCDFTARRAIAFGKNTMAMTVYDLMRSVEFLIEHADADKDRIGTSGISLAGSIAPYFAAVDTRIKATAASCFVVNYRFTQLHQYECGSLVVPGLLEHLDNHEICSLIAPRYLLMERGVKNHRGIAENDVYRHVTGMYEIAECPERLKVDLFYGVHQYNGTKSLDWFDECL